MIKTSIKGNIYIPVLIIITLFVSLGITATTYVINQTKLANQKKYKEMSFQIAEGGIEYYRWHLAHDNGDYQDGTGAPGPYLHDYKDTSGNTIGQFSLDITAPPAGSTVVDLESTGYLSIKPNLTKTIKVVMGIPSFANYAVAANDFMRFGDDTEVWGPIHSNHGIRFDGLAHNVIYSSRADYNDPDHTGANEFGVHTHKDELRVVHDDFGVDPAPPAPVPLRPDIFMAGREFPVPSIDFDGIAAKLDEMQTAANEAGIYLGPSGHEGYYIHFNPNQTVDIYHVTSQKRCRYRQPGGNWRQYGQTKSVDTTESFTYNGASSVGISIDPAASGFNGLIFAEDDVWVDGTINGSRVTVVAAKEPLASGNANLMINNDLLYTNKDGTDSIGLIGQNDVSIGFYSEDNLEINAALIAKSGWIGRYYYKDWGSIQFDPPNCGNYARRDTITVYGTIATNQRYGFSWICSGDPPYWCSGYNIRNLIYDSNFYYAPPPYFPTTGQYRVISWEEE